MSDEHMMKNVSTYEKMLQNPKNRVSSSGTMKQPMPGGTDTLGADTSNIDRPEQPKGSGLDEISAEEQAHLSEIDKRMALRRDGKLPMNERGVGKVDESRIDKIEKQVTEMQELLMEIMKAQMKLING